MKKIYTVIQIENGNVTNKNCFEKNSQNAYENRQSLIDTYLTENNLHDKLEDYEHDLDQTKNICWINFEDKTVSWELFEHELTESV